MQFDSNGDFFYLGKKQAIGSQHTKWHIKTGKYTQKRNFLLVQEMQFQLHQDCIFKTTEKYIAHSNDSKTAGIHVESARFFLVR